MAWVSYCCGAAPTNDDELQEDGHAYCSKCHMTAAFHPEVVQEPYEQLQYGYWYVYDGATYDYCTEEGGGPQGSGKTRVEAWEDYLENAEINA